MSAASSNATPRAFSEAFDPSTPTTTRPPARRRALVADDEHGAPGMGDDLHRDRADAGPAEDPVPAGPDDDEGRRARGVDEGLARVPVAHERRHGEAGVDGVGTRRALGEQPARARRPPRVGAPAEAEHRQVRREGVEDDEVMPRADAMRRRG